MGEAKRNDYSLLDGTADLLDKSIRLNVMDAKQQIAVNLRKPAGCVLRTTAPASLNITPKIRLRADAMPRIQWSTLIMI